MNSPHQFKLFIMMVLEFFIWGAWLPLIFGYCPYLMQNVFTHGDRIDFQGLFLVSTFSSLAAAMALGLFFHPPKKQANS